MSVPKDSSEKSRTIHRINLYVLRIPFRIQNPHVDKWREMIAELPGVVDATDYYRRRAENALYVRVLNEVQLKAAVAWLKSYLGMDYEELSTSWNDVYPD